MKAEKNLQQFVGSIRLLGFESKVEPNPIPGLRFCQ